MNKIQENIDEYALAKCQEIFRAMYRENGRKYREKHREQHNAYCLGKNIEYYQRNKDRLNKQRVEYQRKRKEQKKLEDLETLGKIEIKNTN